MDRLAEDFGLWSSELFHISDKLKQKRLLELNPVQARIVSAELAELKRKGRARLYVLKGRQSGVTTLQQAKALHTVWSTPRAVAITLAHKRDATNKIFEQITQFALRHFPEEMLPVTGGKSATEVSFTALESHFYTETAGAGDAGRSMTISRAHLSEFAFYENPRTVLKAITPALEAPGTVAVLETTASDYDGEAHQFWKENREGGEYRTLFFPWWQCDPTMYRTPLMAPDELGVLTDEEQLLLAMHGLSLEEIKWRREKMLLLGPAEFRQEYPEDDETCWMTAGGMFFSAELLRVLKQRVPKPIEVLENGDLEIFAHPKPGASVIIGADTAEGVGGDRSTFVAREYPSWRLLSRYRSRVVEPKPFAVIINRWGRRYGFAMLVIEKNAHGITVLRELRDDHGYPVSAIYHRHTHDQANSNEERSERIGWATTAESKPLLLDAGRELLQAAKDGLADVPADSTLNDALGVHRDEKGKVDLNGKDELVAEMLAWIGRDTPRSRLLVA